MDSVSDREAQSIWHRIRKRIDTTKLEGKNLEEVNQNLEELMKEDSGGAEKRGSVKRLINNGFIPRINSIPSVQTELKEFIKAEPVRGNEPIKPVPVTAKGKQLRKYKVILPFTFKRNARVQMRVRGNLRTFAQKNISVKFSLYRGKSAFFVSNLRTKKRVTWGVVK